MLKVADEAVEIRHFHLFCGLGGGARGFNRGHARVGRKVARFRCIGGVDVDAAACRDFERLAGVPATRLDMFSREQYIAFHGREPDREWREVTPADIRRAAGNERPHIVFLSAPCKGFSGLLSESQSRTGKYQALNGLTLRGVWLMLEAWKDDPPELIVFENVPRIATRGRHLLDQIEALFRGYAYAVAETTHDCGELGGLAQSRKRFLLVARHMAKVPPFLYEPPKRPLRGVGEVLERLPMPGPEMVLPMHRMPSLHWRTWVRLAFVEAGSDWRSLNRLAVSDGVLRDYGIAADSGYWERCAYGVNAWDQPAGTVTANGRPGSGAFSVADPRIDGHEKSVQMGVRRWDQTAGVVTGKMFVGGGPHSVADPRLQGKPRFNNTFRIVPWGDASPAVAGPGGPAGGLAVADPRAGDLASAERANYGVTGWNEPSGTITSQRSPGQGNFSVADPRPARPPNELHGKYHVTPFDEPARAVISGRDNGAFVVADPRPEAFKNGKEAYTNGGHYGVVPWDQPSYAVTGSGQHDNGRWSVADPREICESDEKYSEPMLPEPGDRLVAVIRALDGTWHRPFTTLELAALQGLVDLDDELSRVAFGLDGPVIDAVRGKHGYNLVLDGTSDSAWRERIGNAVPSPAAEAIAGVMGRTLLLAWSGETFMLSAEPIWVQPVAVGLMAAQG